jgi:alanine racemase
MNYTIKNICDVVNGKFLQFDHNDEITELLIDSRKLYVAPASLFFAIKAPRRNGHEFIYELFEKGVRNFIVSELVKLPAGNIIRVNDVIEAMQQLAASHRSKFKIPVIGITGSNGKTIVKEWLYQLLHDQFNIVRSPKSYNSQIGVPLSVWQMDESHRLGIFEAGISQPGEMSKLQHIIQPTLGILTNIGEAHSENFSSMKEKLAEKLRLFEGVETIIANADVAVIAESLKDYGKKFFSWGKTENAVVKLISIKNEETTSTIILKFHQQTIGIVIPFTDDASVENAITCCCVLLQLNVDPQMIAEKMRLLQPVNMRLELKKGINHCTIINDSYSADLSSLAIALNFLVQQSGDRKKTVILSDFLQTNKPDAELYQEIAQVLTDHKVDRVIGIGERIGKSLRFNSGNDAKMELHLYRSVGEFFQQFRFSHFKEETILVKGARVFEFEEIVHQLEEKAHQTVLEINLNAIVHNLKEYQKYVKPQTRIMAMVKAFAYGSGGAEIAGILQFHKVDYLGVAYADEGVELRKSGIRLRTMVMNPEESSFDAIVENNLEPDIYSFELLETFDKYLKTSGLQQFPVHIEIETGMNRLGFDPVEITKLGEFLKNNHNLKVQSVFSHLASSEDPKQDEFTRQQHKKFQEATEELENIIGYKFLKHISNSAAISRLPDLQMDMVRLGIGMYGVDANQKLDLQTVASFKSTVAQIKKLRAGESVSYNRKGVVKRDSVIATIRVGYADGYPRRLSNGSGKIFVNGKLAPVIGLVCMDMTMIDVTDIPGVQEGDEVIIFGKESPIETIATWAETIPYEIMTGISQRVKRVYYQE